MILFQLLKKRIEIYKVYKNGMENVYFLLRFIIPFIILILFILLIQMLSLSAENILDLIKQINSLIGIILGFCIASFSIFISINNDKLDDKSNVEEYTFRQIGSSLFFYNVERALFIAIMGIFLLYMNIESLEILNYYQGIIKDYNLLISNKYLKFYFFIFYIFSFFQLLLNLFYSTLFLNSSIKKKTL